MITIDGVEVTQAIQHYKSWKHLTDPNDRGPDNSVTLVAYKPAWVRVYVREYASPVPTPPTSVTGTVEVKRRKLGTYSPVLTLTPEPPGSVVAQQWPAYADQRGNVDYTLNFVIPADYMCGLLRLEVEVIDLQTKQAYGEKSVSFDATLKQTLRVRGIFVSYNGPDSSGNLVDLPAPTVADLQNTAAWMMLAYPVASQGDFQSGGTMSWDKPLTDPPKCNGCCSNNWLDLNIAVLQAKTADGNKSGVVYYGLLPSMIPVGPIIGCESGIASGTNGAGITMAHEIGHALGFSHAPCGTPGDPNYPAYEPYDSEPAEQASIGEYGLNIGTGDIFTPQQAHDFMSYCGPRWVSLYNYERIVNQYLLKRSYVCTDEYPWRNWKAYDPFWWVWHHPEENEIEVMQIEIPEYPMISVIGVIHSDQRIEVRSVNRVRAVPVVAGGEPTEFIAELNAENGEVLASGALYRVIDKGTGEGCCGKEESRPPYGFQAFLQDVERGAQLRIRRNQEEMWIRRAPEHSPEIVSFSAQVVEQSQLRAEWDVRSASEQTPDFWLRWSDDEGRSWNALGVDLRGTSATLDLSGVPSGEVHFQLLAHNGFDTVVSEPVIVNVPSRPPVVTILHPRDEHVVNAGGTLWLSGMVTWSHGAPIDEITCRWLIDGRDVGQGKEAWTIAPPAGKHRCTLVALLTESGNTVEESIVFTTVSRG